MSGSKGASRKAAAKRLQDSVRPNVPADILCAPPPDVGIGSANPSASREWHRLIPLTEACGGQDPTGAIRFLLRQGYLGFFLEVPYGATVFQQYDRVGVAGPHELKIPLTPETLTPEICSATHVQLEIPNLEELALGRSTNPLQFRGCLFSKHQETPGITKEYLFISYDRTFLRPRDPDKKSSIPVFTTSTGRAVFARSDNLETGRTSFLIANVTADDLHIVEGSLTVPLPSLEEDDGFLGNGEPIDKDDRSPAEPPNMGSWPFEIEVNDPFNFKERCPAVYELMQIASVRSRTPMPDEDVQSLLGKV